MKKSQRKVVAILIPPPSNSLPPGKGVQNFPLHLMERVRMRKVRVRKTSPSPLKGEDKVRVKSFEGITRSGHSLKRKNMYSILTEYM